MAATHTAATTDTRPVPIDSHTSHHGGGWVDASRRTIPNVLTGGRWLTVTASAESGLRDTAGQMNQGSMTIIRIVVVLPAPLGPMKP